MVMIDRIDQSTQDSLNTKSSNNSVLSNTMDWISDTATFAIQFFRTPKTLGTPVICSPFVSAHLLKYLKTEGPARDYVEVGAGTGAITRHLVKLLRPEDHLDVVEIDPTLSSVLRKNYGHLPNVSIHNKPVQEWIPSNNKKFDAVISTVPLNSLPSAQVLNDIFKSYVKLLKPNGVISSLEYVGTSTLSKTFYFGKTKEKFDAIFTLKNDFFKKYSFERSIVFANLPPARITHCRIPTQNK